MDLWGALGISPQTGLLAAAAGLLAAIVLAAANLRRSSRGERARLDLDEDA